MYVYEINFNLQITNHMLYQVRQKLENKITTKELGSCGKASGFCQGVLRFKHMSRYRQCN